MGGFIHRVRLQQAVVQVFVIAFFLGLSAPANTPVGRLLSLNDYN